jgi:nicotinamide riboside kinase
VVAVSTPETVAFSSVVYLADNRDEYLAAIERALREDSPERQRERMISVQGSSWDSRFRETVTTVDQCLAGHSG